MDIRIVKSCIVHGQGICERDKVVTVSDRDGRFLINIGKAEIAEKVAKAAPQPAKAKKKAKASDAHLFDSKLTD